ncbi:hypothetical protein C8J57DRAFT_1242770 [Mycena rebaudengoi]|nr:hypothetical protein C8J57DRAFT_1242770 [Mycena rebaudengoi]
MTKAENKDSTTSATAHPPHLATIHELKEELFDSHQRYYELATANREISQKLRTAEQRITEEIHLGGQNRGLDCEKPEPKIGSGAASTDRGSATCQGQIARKMGQESSDQQENASSQQKRGRL